MKNGKLPSGWKLMSVESLCAEGAPVRYGILQPGPDVPEGVFYLRPTEIDNDQIHSGTLRRTTPAIANQYRRSSLLTNDIILSIVGTIGKVAVVPDWLEGGNITQSSARIRADTSKILVDYLANCLRSPFLVDQFGAVKMGTAVTRLNIAHVRALQIPVPPLAEQQRIVGLLDEAFEGLATAKANAEKNLQNARALFESHLQSVFTQRGPGWVDTALGGVCGFVRGPFGGSLKKSIFVADGFAVYEQQHAIYDQFDDVRYFIDEAKFKEMKRFELLPDDLIMSCSGTMGRVAIVPKDIKRGIINQALLKLTPSSKILNTFLKSWMESEAFQDALKEYSGGAAIQNVASVKNLKEIKVPLPSMSDQKRVVEELDDLREETQRLARLYERKQAALEALKKSLLHQAFTGEL